MITVILADDDFLVRETLSEVIPWKELGMEVIGQAENGKQALDMCIEKKPDVLFTDIKMPFLNGLEVAISLQELGINTRIVLISGIQDFNYAKTALSLNAAGYILKPIQIKEIIEAMKKIRNSIDMEQNRAEVYHQFKRQLEEHQDIIKEKFLNNLLLGIITDKIEIHQKLEYFQLSLNEGENIIVAVAEIDDYPKRVENQTESDKQFLNFSVKNIIEKCLFNHQAGLCICTRDNQFGMILNRRSNLEDAMALIFDEIQDLLQDFNNITISIGIGNKVTNLDAISISYNNALNALNYKFYTGKNSIIHIEDISNTQKLYQMSDVNVYTNLNAMQKELLSQIKLGNTEKLSETVESYFSFLTEVKLFTEEYIRGVCIELIINAYQETFRTEIDVQEILPHYLNSVQEILKLETVFEMKQTVYRMLEHICNYFKSKYSVKHGNLVRQIKEMAEKRYMENITLSDIANEVYMSPNYICSVFKKEAGITINEYLIKVKMEEAKKMLKDTKMKIHEIAEKLGYESPHYFSYSFKKNTGKTPQQYRN
jgi:Response regulator containing CheY-like receiver domain and AraC-type DNA-binding domain